MNDHAKTSASADRLIIRTSNTVPISRRATREINSRAKQLREWLPDLDRELGLTFPVIDIVQILFFTSIEIRKVQS